MNSTVYPPNVPSEKYPDDMTSAKANDWLNENIPLPPGYSWERKPEVFEDWIDYQDAAWMFYTRLR